MRASVLLTIGGESTEAIVHVQDVIAVFPEHVEAAIEAAKAKQAPTWDWDKFSADVLEQLQLMQR